MSEYDDINLYKHSNKKYNIKSNSIGSGAFSQVYDCIKLKKENEDYVVKVQLIADKHYAITELNILNKIKKNNSKFLEKNINHYNNSNIIIHTDYYLSRKYIYIIYEKCHVNLELFNVKYLKKYNKQLPLFIIKKIIYSIVNGIAELNFNNIIHCDIKLDNILIKFCKTSFKSNGKQIHKYIESMDDFLELIDTNIDGDREMIINSAFELKIIDFNKSCFSNQIYKSINIQTLYFQAPEIILGYNKYNNSVDSWSIGCIIWWLLTSEIFVDVYNHNLDYGSLYQNYEFDFNDNNTNNTNNTDDTNTTITVLTSSSSNKSVGTINSISNISNNSNTINSRQVRVGNASSNSFSSNSSISESSVSTNSITEYGSYNENKLENYIYLLKLNSYLGEYPKHLIKGKKVDYYFANKQLLCNTIHVKKIDMLQYLSNKIENFKVDNSQYSKYYKYISNIYNNVLSKIFVYDYNKRYTPSDILEYLNISAK